MASDHSGHDKNYLETPPDDLTCLICHSVARDPLQTQCCGKLYCKSCLERHSQNEGTCPTCRKRRFSTFSDQLSNRRIKALKLMCDNEEKGCKWTGELDQLEQHIAAECMFAEVPASNGCSKTLLRSNMQKHLKRECPHREYKCPHCKEYGKYQTMTCEHLRQCPNLRIPCPNVGCNVRKTRLEIKVHRKTCRKEKVACSYCEVGCDVYKTRETLEQHETECMERHLQLAMKKITSLASSLQGITSLPPQVFKMPNFDTLKRDNEVWYSPCFYTHTGGYKMCLEVNANGDQDGNGKGTHVSVYVYIMASKNDKNLLWPFRGEISLELLNQLDDRNHKVYTLNYDTKGIEDYNCIADGGKSFGWGTWRFISQGALSHNPANNCQYLKDDCLFFRLTQVKVYTSNKPWLTPCS